MVENLSIIFKISRPRFWSYLAGPFLIGFVMGNGITTTFTNPLFYVFLLYFLIPANVMLYGINDLFDNDTDMYNAKKKTHELLFKSYNESVLQMSVLVSVGISVLLIILAPNIITKIIFICFLLLSIFYSTPPFRFKKHPFIDSISNILYVLPGLFGYMFYNNSLSIPALTAIAVWPVAMHLFSAIPDIDADKKAKLKTTAVILGSKKSLVLCTVLWSICVIAAYNTGLSKIALLGIVYPLLPLLALKTNKTEKIYWFFPYINTLLGCALFFYVVFVNGRI